MSTISPEAASKSGDSSSPSAAVHIVYTEKPQDDDHEAYYIRILSSVHGSEEAAKEALIYSYKTAATGFSAKLTPDQVSQISVANISANLNSIPVFNGTNFNDWKENIQIVLGCMDMDLAIRTEKPTTPTATSSSEEKAKFEKWDRSNRMILMIIKRAIPEVFRGAVSEDTTNAKEYLAEIEKRFAKSNKAETSNILKSLISMKYKGKGNIREYIMEMSHLSSKLKTLKFDLHEDLLVHLILISLPVQFNHFKVSFNCQKETWNLNELISHCVQEEERLKQEKTESAHLASTSKDKGKKRKDVNAACPNAKKQNKANDLCFFCNKAGHIKKDCIKYRAWRGKKGLPELPKAK